MVLLTAVAQNVLPVRGVDVIGFLVIPGVCIVIAGLLFANRRRAAFELGLLFVASCFVFFCVG